MTGFDLREIDRIGERLRSGTASEADYGVLRLWKRSFEPAFETVASAMLRLGIQFTARDEKSDASIIAKLKRGQPSGDAFRLSRLQDIAGIRIVCDDRARQDELIAAIQSDLRESLRKERIADRRAGERVGKSGYRAVHLVPLIGGVPVEIQLRTLTQDLWANICEQLAFEIDPALRIGGGPAHVLHDLRGLSERWSGYEDGSIGAVHWPTIVIEGLQILTKFSPPSR